jgi:hypothetical protein
VSVSGGGVAGFGWRIGVDLHLNEDGGWFGTVALSGLFSGLKHSGHQILGSNSQSHVVLNTGVYAEGCEQWYERGS